MRSSFEHQHHASSLAVDDVQSSDSGSEVISVNESLPQNKTKGSRPILAPRHSNFPPHSPAMFEGTGVKRRRLSHEFEDAAQRKRHDKLKNKNAWRRGDGFADSTPVNLDGPHFTKPSFTTPVRPLSRATHFAPDQQYPSDDTPDQASQTTQRRRFLPVSQSPKYDSTGFDRPTTPSSSTRPRFSTQATPHPHPDFSERSHTNPTPRGDNTVIPNPAITSPTTTSLLNNRDPDPWLISTTFSPRKLKNRFTASGWASLVRRWIVEAAYSTSATATSASNSISNIPSSRTRDTGILIRITQTPPQLQPPKLPRTARRAHRNAPICIVRGTILNSGTANIPINDINTEVNILLSHSQGSSSSHALDHHATLSDPTQTQWLQGKTIQLTPPVERLDLTCAQSSCREQHDTAQGSTTDDDSGIIHSNENAMETIPANGTGIWLICVGAFEVVASSLP